MTARTVILLKRTYEPPNDEDGQRILVERLWPRGISKEKLRLDHWAKQIAPSPGLRTWYGHEPARWEQFQQRYRRELEANIEEVADLAHRIEHQTASFLFAARDEERNSAVVLRAYLLERI